MYGASVNEGNGYNVSLYEYTELEFFTTLRSLNNEGCVLTKLIVLTARRTVLILVWLEQRRRLGNYRNCRELNQLAIIILRRYKVG